MKKKYLLIFKVILIILIGIVTFVFASDARWILKHEFDTKNVEIISDKISELTEEYGSRYSIKYKDDDNNTEVLHVYKDFKFNKGDKITVYRARYHDVGEWYYSKDLARDNMVVTIVFYIIFEILLGFGIKYINKKIKNIDNI